MLKRPFCGMAVSFLLGILGAAYLGEGSAIGGFFLLGWICCICLAKFLPGTTCLVRIRVCACGILMVMGYQIYAKEQMKREAYLPTLTDGMQLTIQGEVAGKQFKNQQFIYELTSCYIGAGQNQTMTQESIACNQILAYSDSDVASIGEILILNGTVELWDTAVNEGNFDSYSFYLARKTDFSLRDIRVLETHGKESLWQEALFTLRLRLKEVYKDTMTEEACGVMATMVLGDKTLLDAETKRLYQLAGLSHIMAISGLHISVIGMTLYRFLRKRGLGFWISGILAGTLLYLYGTMVGMGTSVRRSVGMFIMLLLGEAIGRSYDSLNALGVMALFLLWENPYLVWDAGFQFSFTAILGIVWVGGCMSFAGMPNEKVKAKLWGSVSVQLATLPLVAWHYFEVPTYAMLINLIVLPVMGALLSLGVAGGLLGLFTQKGSAAVLFFCEKLLALIRMVCGLCEKLPNSMVIIGRPKLWQMILYYMILVGFTLFMYQRQKRERTIGYLPKGKFILLIPLLLVILIWKPIRQFELDVLDVGQGDAIFVRTMQGHTLFVDGGSSNVSSVGTYRILPFLKYKGVGQIDFWIVSHTDEDHISGLREVLMSGYPVERLLFAENIVQNETYEELAALAQENGTQILYIKAGDILHIGDAKLHVLYPAVEGESVFEAEDTNASSLVFLYEEASFSGIFTGDTGSEQEEKMCEIVESLYQDATVSDTSLEFYKAAHHGSKYSNSKKWLELLNPEISVISCAKRNSYGHPAAEAVSNMESAGSKIFYTMDSGQVTVTMEEDVEVKEFFSGKR